MTDRAAALRLCKGIIAGKQPGFLVTQTTPGPVVGEDVGARSVYDDVDVEEDDGTEDDDEERGRYELSLTQAVHDAAASIC